MPNPKNLMSNAVVGAISVVGTLLITNWINAAEEGSDALQNQKIREVIVEVLDDKLKTTIRGETYTYGEALSLIHSETTALTAAFEALTAE